MDRWQWGGTGIAVVAIFLPMTGVVSQTLGWVGVAVGAGLIAAPFLYHRLQPEQPEAPQGDLRNAPPAPAKPEYIPLPKAAQKVLEANLTQLLGIKAMKEPTPERRLNYVGIYIANTIGVRLYGKRPPLTVIERVPPEHMGRYRMEVAAELYLYGENLPSYVGLEVRSDDLAEHWPDIFGPQ